MRNFILSVLLLVVLAVQVNAQTDIKPYFSELNGMKDYEGKVHLLYRIYSEKGNPIFYENSNNIYNMIPGTSTDTLFLWDGVVYGYMDYGRIVNSYDFWNNDISKHIYCGGYVCLDPCPYIARFDTTIDSDDWNIGYSNVIISKQNDSIVYASSPLKMSTDGGISWRILSDTLNFLSLSPLDDRVIFASAWWGNKLYKSTDGGTSFFVVDTMNNYTIKFYHDINGSHIYRTDYGNILKRSSEKGNAYTWENIYTGGGTLYISLDESESGNIYIAEGKKIFHSADFGASFQLFKEMEYKITGIYKRPDSDILYVSTKYKIYEVTGNSVNVIKSLPMPLETLLLYPLKAGDKWIYDYTHYECPTYYCPSYSDIYSREVTSERILQNGKKYYEIVSSYGRAAFTRDTVYERIDTLNWKIFRYSGNNPDDEILIEDLTMDINDSCYSHRYGYGDEHMPTVLTQREQSKWWGYEGMENNYFHNNLLTVSYKLFPRVGLTYISLTDDNGLKEYSLKGMLKDGVVFGDTTLTDVDDSDNQLPVVYKLEQNYPNPFNPSTVIKYQMPENGYVTLKIYDILGTEITTLENEEKSAGRYEVNFNASGLSSGVYIYQVKVNGFIASRKMVMMK